MQTIESENRVVTKSFRTTAAIAEALKNITTLHNEEKMSESDIINTALEDYISINLKKNNEINKAWDDNNLNKISKLLEYINTTDINEISSPKDVANYFKGKLPKDKEAAYTLYLDTENKIIKTEFEGIGNNETVGYDYSKIIKNALNLNPCHIIIVHNHPGLGVNPSNADIIETKKFYTACQFSNVIFTDAIILDDNYKHYSFNKHGHLKQFKNDFFKIDKLFIQKAVK